MFVIDFDDTLFQTHKFKQMRVGALKSAGVPSSVDDEIYKKARNSPDGMLTYSNIRHAEILASYGYDYDKALYVLEKTTEKEVLAGLLADGAKEFLQYLRDQGQTLVLLSLGSSEFQELKVRGCGVHELFDRMFMVHDTKEHILNELFEHIGDEAVWFVNDKIEETKKLCSKFFKLKPILKVSQLFPIDEYINSGMKYFNNFNELKEYVSGEIK